MTRKTKAELVAEREAALAAARLEEQLAYPSRLMAALEDAVTNNNYQLTVSAGFFVVSDRNARRPDQFYELTYSYSTATQFNLEELEDALRNAAEERALAARRYEMKQIALAKLTNEERELLGI